MAIEVMKRRQLISERALRIPKSIIVEVRERVKKLKAQNVDVIDMSSGDIEPGSTSMELKDALCSATNVIHHGYPYAQGIMELREHISNYFSRTRNTTLGPEHIGITNGGIQGLNVAFAALINEGDEAIFPEPRWAPASNIVLFYGGNPVYVPLDKKFQLDLERIVDSITSKTKIIYLNTPGNNPSGSVYNKKTLEELAKTALDKEIALIFDEPYRDLVYDDVEIFDPLSSQDILENSIVLGSFSKSHSATGWRCGYFTTKMKDFVEKVEFMGSMSNIILHQTSGVSSPIQHAFSQVPMSGQIVEKPREAYRIKRDRLVTGLSQIDGFEVVMPQAGLYAFPRFNNIPSKYRTSEERSNYICSLIESCDTPIFGVPGIEFGSSFSDYIRLTFSVCDIYGIGKAIDVLSHKLGRK